jgi:hypothetical protein
MSLDIIVSLYDPLQTTRDIIVSPCDPLQTNRDIIVSLCDPPQRNTIMSLVVSSGGIHKETLLCL